MDRNIYTSNFSILSKHSKLFKHSVHSELLELVKLVKLVGLVELVELLRGLYELELKIKIEFEVLRWGGRNMK